MDCQHCGEFVPRRETTCAFCGAAVAPEPAPAVPAGDPAPPPSGDFATVATCATLVEADALRARLESAGFEVHVPDEALMQSAAWNPSTYGYVRIQVRAADLAEARGLVEAKEPAVPAGPDAATPAGPPPIAGAAAEWPLPRSMALISFPLPIASCGGIGPFLLLRANYLRQGCDRRARESLMWFAAGFAVWNAAWVVLYLVSPVFGHGDRLFR